MQQRTLAFTLTLKQTDELTPTEQRLVDAAKAATYRSYAPYSRFSVGAAALLGDGSVVCGSNQENAAYPSGLCAERTTLFYAGSQYPEEPVTALCIAARATDGQFTPRPIAPCGACRQVLLETEQRQGPDHPLRVILYGTDVTLLVPSAQDLLPLAFDASFL